MRGLAVAAMLVLFAASCASTRKERAPIAQHVATPRSTTVAVLDDPEAAERIHVEPLGGANELLWVDAAAATSLSDEALAKALEPRKERIAHLGLARTHAGPKTLALTATMPHLERLDLRATSIGTKELALLGAHASLKSLVLVQTKLDDGAIDALLALPALASVHAWRSGLSATAIERLRKSRPKLVVDDGTQLDAQVAEREAGIVLGGAKTASTAPSSATPASLTPINKTCPVSGSPVSASYAIVFEGRVIAFCCPNCPTKFWASPETYRTKLP